MTETIDTQYRCTKITIGCPHCINADHGVDAPWFFVDEAEYDHLVKTKGVMRCPKPYCAQEFSAEDAITSETDSRFRLPFDDDGMIIQPMWCAISCPSCMSTEGKNVRWQMVWAKGFLRCQRFNLIFRCPACNSPYHARDYGFRRE